jgi:hypothetical protein
LLRRCEPPRPSDKAANSSFMGGFFMHKAVNSKEELGAVLCLLQCECV